MNAYRLARLPNNDSIASSVTLLVAGWFLVAAGAILADPASPYTQRPVAAPMAQAPAAVRQTQLAAAPDAHLTITVSARRSSAASLTQYSL